MYVGPWQEYKLMKVIEDLREENDRIKEAFLDPQSQNQQQQYGDSNHIALSSSMGARYTRPVPGRSGEVHLDTRTIAAPYESSHSIGDSNSYGIGGVDPFQTYPPGHFLSTSPRSLAAQQEQGAPPPFSAPSARTLHASRQTSERRVRPPFVIFHKDTSGSSGANPQSRVSGQRADAISQGSAQYPGGGADFYQHSTLTVPTYSAREEEILRKMFLKKVKDSADGTTSSIGSEGVHDSAYAHMADLVRRVPLDTNTVSLRAGQKVYERCVKGPSMGPCWDARGKIGGSTINVQSQPRLANGGVSARKTNPPHAAEDQVERRLRLQALYSGVAPEDTTPTVSAAAMQKPPLSPSPAAVAHSPKSSSTSEQAGHGHTTELATAAGTAVGGSQWGVPWDTLPSTSPLHMTAGDLSTPLYLDNTTRIAASGSVTCPEARPPQQQQQETGAPWMSSALRRPYDVGAPLAPPPFLFESDEAAGGPHPPPTYAHEHGHRHDEVPLENLVVPPPAPLAIDEDDVGGLLFWAENLDLNMIDGM